MRKSYKIRTLDALELIQHAYEKNYVASAVSENKENKKPEFAQIVSFTYDLRNGNAIPVLQKIVLASERHSGNAFFYQILQCLKAQEERKETIKTKKPNLSGGAGTGHPESLSDRESADRSASSVCENAPAPAAESPDIRAVSDLLLERVFYVDFKRIYQGNTDFRYYFNRLSPAFEAKADSAGKPFSEFAYNPEEERLPESDDTAAAKSDTVRESPASGEPQTASGSAQPDEMQADSANSPAEEMPAAFSAEQLTILRKMFLKGLTFTYPDGRTVTYRPYDKSNSMARQSVTTFVDESLICAEDGPCNLESRLRLDMKFDQFKDKVFTSKYFAYKGLYFSDGIRIDLPPECPLNEETVLVLPETLYESTDPVVQHSSKYTRLSQQQGCTADKTQIASVKHPLKDQYIISVQLGQNGEILEQEPQIMDISVKAFDGEGLISPKYAALLNSAFRGSGPADSAAASSFQIRMPFTKGMLHKVDFHKFVREQLFSGGEPDAQSENRKIENLKIIDAFGISRDFSKAQILLTESMFKAVNWLAEYTAILAKEKSSFCTNLNPSGTDTASRNFTAASQQKGAAASAGPTVSADTDSTGVYRTPDPMAYYFDKFHKYDHGLYIRSTDLSFSRSKARMNYQLLNPLDMEPAEFEKLVDHQLDLAKNAGRVTRAELLEDMKNGRGMSAWQYAYALNPDFSQNSYISDKCKQEQDSILKRIPYGRFDLDGCQRLLSDDLLSFLIYMILCLDLPTKQLQKTTEALREKTLLPHKCYLPGWESFQTENFFSQPYLSLFRNPHLSRNEECALRPYIPFPEEKGDLYETYFSDLKGIVMLGYHSNAALAMGGADFDGDFVKVVFEPSVTQAVLRGAYREKAGKDNQTIQRRVLPLPYINAPKTDPPKMPESRQKRKAYDAMNREYYADLFQTTHNTFTNSIGLLSNAAISFGRELYFKSPDGQAGNQADSGDTAAVFESDTATVGSSNREAVSSGDIGAVSNDKTATGSNDGIKAENEALNPHLCALCTVITGLDIDAAKHGNRPDVAAFLKKHKTNSRQDYYLKRKKAFEKSGGDSFGDCKMTAGSERITSNIDRLPWYYIESLNKLKKNRKKTRSASRKKEKLFRFEEQKGWDKNLNPEILEQIDRVICTYNQFEQFRKQYRSRQEQEENSRFLNNVHNILRIEYDYDTDRPVPFASDMQTTVETAYITLKEAFAGSRGAIETPGSKDSSQEPLIGSHAAQNICTDPKPYTDRKPCTDQEPCTGSRAVSDALVRLSKLQWVTTYEDKRKEVLEHILGKSIYSDLPDVVLEFLLDRSENGFWFLYYMLKEVETQLSREEHTAAQLRFTENERPTPAAAQDSPSGYKCLEESREEESPSEDSQPSPGDSKDSLHAPKTAEGNPHEETPSKNSQYDRKLYGKLLARWIKGEAEKEIDAIRMADIRNLYLKRILDILLSKQAANTPDEADEAALKYLYACRKTHDKNGRFFWEVFLDREENKQKLKEWILIPENSGSGTKSGEVNP